MRKMTINKGNWSGEEITVKINEDNTFELYDYMFKLTTKQAESETLYAVTSPDWDYPVVLGYEDKTSCVMYSNGCADLSREAKDPFEAAINVLCTIL